MALTRSTPGTKLLARHEHDNASHPFATADWTAAAGITLGLSGGRLTVAQTADGAYRWVQRTGVASRGNTLVQWVVRSTSTGGQTVLDAHVSDIAPGSEDGVGYFMTVDSQGVSGIYEYINGGVNARGTNTGAGTKATGTDYRVSLHVNGLAYAGYDFAAGLLRTGTGTTHAAGGVGAHFLGTRNYEIARYIVAPGRYVTVTGVPAGGSARVRNTGNTTTLASAAESGGTATIDMLGVALETATVLEVLNSGGTVVGTYQSAGEIVEPGETYAYAPAPSAPAATLRAIGPDNLTATSAAFSYPGSSATHQATEARARIGATVVYGPVAADTLTRHTFPGLSAAEHALEFRHQGSDGAWSGWGAAALGTPAEFRGYTPQGLPDASSYFSAFDVAGVANGAKIPSITDRVTGRVLSAVSGTSFGSTYNAADAALGGTPSFGASGTHYEAASGWGTSAVHSFVAVVVPSGTSSDERFVWTGGERSNGAGYGLTSDGLVARLSRASTALVTAATPAGVGTVVIGTRAADGTARIYRDGVQIQEALNTTAPTINGSELWALRGISGRVGATGSYVAALTPTQVSKLTAWLRIRHGLSPVAVPPEPRRSNLAATSATLGAVAALLPAGRTLASVRHQVATDAGFTSIIHDGTGTALTGLTEGVTYHHRVAGTLDDGTYTGFSSAATFVPSTPPAQPSLTIGGRYLGALDASSSTYSGGAYAHASSDWEAYPSGAVDAAGVPVPGAVPVASSYSNTSNLTAWTANGLQRGTEYALRVRHRNQHGAASAWSLARGAAVGITKNYALLSLGTPDRDAQSHVAQGYAKASLSVGELHGIQMTGSGGGWVAGIALQANGQYGIGLWSLPYSGGVPIYNAGTITTGEVFIKAVQLGINVTFVYFYAKNPDGSRGALIASIGGTSSLSSTTASAYGTGGQVRDTYPEHRYYLTPESTIEGGQWTFRVTVAPDAVKTTNFSNSSTLAEIEATNAWFPGGPAEVVHPTTGEVFARSSVVGGSSYWFGVEPNLSAPTVTLTHTACASTMQAGWNQVVNNIAGTTVLYDLSVSRNGGTPVTMFQNEPWSTHQGAYAVDLALIGGVEGDTVQVAATAHYPDTPGSTGTATADVQVCITAGEAVDVIVAQSPCDQLIGITVVDPTAPAGQLYDYQKSTGTGYTVLASGRPSPYGHDKTTLAAGTYTIRARRAGTNDPWLYSERFTIAATRAPTAAELATVGAAKRTLGFKLIINDSAGIPRDRTEFLTGVTINADINQPVTSAELTIRREHRGASLAPMLTASPLNQPHKAVDLSHGFSIAAATVPAGVRPSPPDYRTIFCGNVDSHEFARPEAQVQGRDIFGQLILDKEIEEDRVYGAADGTVSLEAGIQAIFDDNMPPSRRVTVVVPTPTGATMGQYTQPKGPLLPAGRERALQIGYDLRGLWRSATGLYSMTLYEPTRNALAAPSYIFGPDEYLDVQAVPEDVSLIRNRLRIFYGAGEGDARASVLVEDPTSAAYPELGGYGPRYAEIHLDPGSLIQTAPEAETVGKRIITDMSQPAATMVVEVPFFWLAELNAVYRLEADNIRFAANLDLACVGFRHEIRKGEQSGTWRARTFLTMRARPAAQTYEWLTVERMPAPTTPTTAPGMQITKFAAAVNDPGKCGVSPATVITDWALTNVVAGTQVVLEYEAIAGDNTGAGIWTAVGTYAPTGNPVGHTWTGYETVSSFFANQTNPAMLAYRIRLVDAGGVQLKDANDVPLIRSVPRFFVFFKKCAA